MGLIFGVDVGIGSVAVAVIRNDDNAKRIEDFAVRIFDSGEIKGSKRKSQDRRATRSARRLITRRHHRKERLKAHLFRIGLTTNNQIKAYYEEGNNDIISTRVRGLDEKLSPQEIAACLIHMCNYRGYNEYYEIDEDNMTKEELKEAKEEYAALGTVNEIMKKGGYRTVAEMYAKDSAFANKSSTYRSYRNRAGMPVRLIKRSHVEHEFDELMKCQKKFYPQLTEDNINKAKSIIFSQRDFEDGPGNAEDKHRKYMGFLDTIGKCRFYKDEKRGSRSTLIADLYSCICAFSQYLYFDKNGEKLSVLPTELCKKAIESVLSDGKITFNEYKKLCQSFGIEINQIKGETVKLADSFKFMPMMKRIIDETEFEWNDCISNYLSDDNLLNRLGHFLSENITPKRREKRFSEAFPELPLSLARAVKNLNAGSTAAVSEKYMTGIINSFVSEGELAYNNQYEALQEAKSDDSHKHFKLPPFNKDDEFFDNPVVLRSLNEARKVINAFIELYGSPSAINIEVATELNRTFEERAVIERNNKKNREERDKREKDLHKRFPDKKITPELQLRHRLWEQQGGRCLYSDAEIPEEMLFNSEHALEVDHIIPFSLILDDTAENKALVLASENQEKGQKAPLMYLSGDKEKKYIARVNLLLKNKQISKKKYAYLMTRSLDSELLDGWKSRNINDTRYISKYLVNYIRSNLQFSEGKEDIYRERVYAVKSSLTSRFRQAWLNPLTWGMKDKSQLKEFTYLDHVVDAIVVANLIPAYAELAQVQMKLARIYRKEKRYTAEYNEILDNCIATMVKYYHMKPEEIRRFLTDRTTEVSPIISRLKDEVDNRVCDIQSFNYFDSLTETPQKLSDEEIEKLFRSRIMAFYADKGFAEKIEMPITSHKQDFRLQMGLTDSNAASMIESDGEKYILKRKAVAELTKGDIAKIRTSDKELISMLEGIFEGADEKATLGKIMGDEKLAYITTGKGTVYKKVTVMTKPGGNYYIKEIGYHDDSGQKRNYSVLPKADYYCIEIYRTKKGDVNLTGIAPIDIVKINGKMYLRSDYTYPEDYAEHIEYLFKRDYIELYCKDKKGVETCYFKGYYASCENINRNKIATRRNNSSTKAVTFVRKTTSCVRKRNISILGKMGGYIRCGEPLSSAPEKK